MRTWVQVHASLLFHCCTIIRAAALLVQRISHGLVFKVKLSRSIVPSLFPLHPVCHITCRCGRTPKRGRSTTCQAAARVLVLSQASARRSPTVMAFDACSTGPSFRTPSTSTGKCCGAGERWAARTSANEPTGCLHVFLVDPRQIAGPPPPSLRRL